MAKDKKIKSIIDPVYVVTRDGRRADPYNFLSKADAVELSRKLSDMVRKWDPKGDNKIEVKKTTSPHRIR